MYILESIKFKQSKMYKVRVHAAPVTTPLIIDTFDDRVFIESLMRSRLSKGKEVYILFFNQTNDVLLTNITEENINDFFMKVFYPYVSDTGYRYCYIPGIFPVTDIWISHGDTLTPLLEWSINLIDEIYDVPEYVEEFKSFIDAGRMFKSEDKLKLLLNGNNGFVHKLISPDLLSYRFEEFTFEFCDYSIGKYDEYLYSLDASLYNKKGFYFTYFINSTMSRLELWVTYPFSMCSVNSTGGFNYDT